MLLFYFSISSFTLTNATTMVVSDANDNWIDNTMDAATKETVAPSLPDLRGSIDTLYIPEFVTQHGCPQ
jgi:hypothetical protein